MRVLLEITKFHQQKKNVCQVRLLFEGGPYMRKYGTYARCALQL